MLRSSRSLLLPALAVVWAALLPVAAQPRADPEEGAPNARRYGWDDYRGHGQNWAIAQAPSGLVYAANTLGVLEYDGSDWRLMPFDWDARTLVRSVAVGRSGRLYVGGIGELGWLAPDSSQTLRFQSLVHLLPAASREFSDVWSTHSTPGGIAFQTPEFVYRWNGRRMQAWRATTRFHLAFSVGDRLFVREEGVGLRELRGDRLDLVAGGDAFAERRVFALLDHPTGLMAAVVDEGLMVLDRSGALQALDGSGSDYLRSHRPYAGRPIGGGRFALATLGGGVLVVDARGEIVRVLREDVGIGPDDWVLGLAGDRQGGLWLALLNGIIRLDDQPRLTGFGSREGLTGAVYSIERHEGILYVGTSTGVFRLVGGRAGRPGEGPAYARFEPLRTTDGSTIIQAWGLLSASGSLLVATNEGLFHLRGGLLERLNEVKSLRLAAMPGRPDVIVGEKTGLRMLQRTPTGWRLGEPFTDISGEINSFAFAGRDVWVGLMDGGVVRLTPQGSRYRVAHFPPGGGLADGPATVVRWADGVRIIQQAGVLRPVPTAMGLSFVRDPRLRDVEGQYGIFGMADGRSWLYQNQELRAVTGEPFALRFGWAQIETVFEEPTGVLWVGTDAGLFRYDPRVPLPARPFPAFIRRVTDEQRNTLYGGAPTDAAPGQPALVLPYERGSIRIEFSAAAFSRPEGTDYQFRLDGLDEAGVWTPFAPERSTNYTQLWEGTYTFRVRGRDAYGRPGDVAAFTFRILPPWYRTVWAYLGYLVGIGSLLWGLVAWRTHVHRLQTETERARAQRLARLGARLREANTRLRREERLKDELLANASHELRTPLTAVMGFSEMLLDEIPDDQRDLAEGIHRGGARLLGTVDGLLDMHKLQTGTLVPTPEPLDAAALVRSTVATLAPLAASRGLTLRVLPETLALPACLDRGLVERVLMQLVGNAVKFTDTGGVDVLVDGDEASLHLTVRDTGIGIAPEWIDRVWEPFVQASTGHGRTHEGTGLGLSIVRRLVDLSGGEVTLESTPGTGTTVRVRLPRYATPGVRTHGTGQADPALLGAHVFALCLPDEAERALREWIEPSGQVLAGATLREARQMLRRTTCDVVFLPAEEADVEVPRVARLRAVPGYAQTPIVRVGGTPLDPGDLASRGFTHQMALPLDPDRVMPLIEHLLLHVEAVEDDPEPAPVSTGA